MRPARDVFVALVVAVLIFPAATAGAGGLLTQPVDADVVVMTADVDTRGDAVWSITYRVRLADDSDEAAFDDIQTDIQTNTTIYTDRFRDRMVRTVRTAENATGRNMTIENISVETGRETFSQTYGVITYRFTWRNFTAVDDDRITVGDALAGFFLDRGTSLTLRWPTSYQAETVDPAPDDRSERSVTWRGQRSFGTDEPRVVTAPASSGSSGGALVGGVVVVVGIVIAFVLGRRYVTGQSDDETTEQQGNDSPPADLLSNEEQVLSLLEDNGGRLKQQRIGTDLDWTDAKTSQVIGGLRDDDRVETFRIGRENVVTLPETDVTGSDESNYDT
jgi:hypothetical protein